MYGYRQLKDVFKKNKWTLLISVWSTAIICLHLQYISKWKADTANLDGHSPMTIDQNVLNTSGSKPTIPQIKYYDVLLNSYMRSGSTLTGIILGWREDALYLYEPLWKLSRWTYWHGNDTVCRSDRLACRPVDAGKAVQDRTFPENINRLPGGSLVLAQKILSKFYDCQFNDFERTVLQPGLTDKLGGPGWSEVLSCIKMKTNPKLCLHRFIPRKCKNATHKVTKVLRLTTDLLGNLLRERPNLKVVHLFRDPRAIINSRNHTAWYTAHTPRKLIENAKSLCNKMLFDFREGKKLQALYPDRFKFIYYEDLNEDPFTKAKMLYKFLGMDLNESKYPKVRTLPVFSNSTTGNSRHTNTAYWWRMSLSWEVVQKMDTVCADVYKELGYKFIPNVQDYRDMSISTVDIPKDFLMN